MFYFFNNFSILPFKNSWYCGVRHPAPNADKNVAFPFFHFWEVSSVVFSNPLLCFVILYLKWKALPFDRSFYNILLLLHKYMFSYISEDIDMFFEAFFFPVESVSFSLFFETVVLPIFYLKRYFLPMFC